MDDILKEQILDSAKEREKLKRWYFSALMPAVNPDHYKVIAVGTPMTEDDILNEFKIGKTFKTIVVPIAQNFPGPRHAIIPAWPDLHNVDRIVQSFEAAKEMDAESDFFREKMLQVVNEEMRIIKDSWIKRYRYGDWKMENAQCNYYTTMDLAVSKKEHADSSCIITIAVDPADRRRVVAIDFGKFTPTEIVNKLFNHVKRFAPVEVRAEQAALQQVLNDFIEKEMIRRKTYFLLEPLDKNTEDSKDRRIHALVPQFKMGLWYLPTDIDQDAIAELLYEIRGYTKTGATTRYKDAIDALANFCDPDFVYPPQNFIPTEIEEDIADEDDYYF